MHICNKIARKFTFECDFIANGLHYATVVSYYCFLLFFVHYPEGYSGTFLQKVHFLKIAISFTPLIPSPISPTDDRENSDSTPHDKKVTKPEKG